MKDTTTLWNNSAWVTKKLFHIGDIGFESLVSLNHQVALALQVQVT